MCTLRDSQWNPTESPSLLHLKQGLDFNHSDPESHDKRWYCDPITEINAYKAKTMLRTTKTRPPWGAKT